MNTNLDQRGTIWSDYHEVFTGEGDWIADLGDMSSIPRDHDEAMSTITGVLCRLMQGGARPLIMGGDHSCSYASVRAVAERVAQPVFLIHLDAHPDTGVSEQMDHGTWVRNLVEDGHIVGAAQYGLRGHNYGPEEMAFAKEAGIKVVHDIASITNLVPDGVPVYLSCDIDVVDPAFAPGTGTPEPGGMSSREFLDTVRFISATFELCGADIMEVCPAYDHASGVTSMLANRAIIEIAGGWQDKELSKLNSNYKRTQ